MMMEPAVTEVTAAAVGLLAAAAAVMEPAVTEPTAAAAVGLLAAPAAESCWL